MSYFKSGTHLNAEEKVDILIELTDSYSFSLYFSIAYGGLHVSDWRRNLNLLVRQSSVPLVIMSISCVMANWLL